MNRKLKNSLTALSASAVVLAAALLAGTPTGAGDRPDAAQVAGTDGGGTSPSRMDRRGLALPYFSFARGVRRIGG